MSIVDEASTASRAARMVPLKIANTADQIGRKIRKVTDEVEDTANEILDKGAYAAATTAGNISNTLAVSAEENMFLRALGRRLLTPSIIGSVALLTYEIHKYMLVKGIRQKPKVVSKIEKLEDDKKKLADMQHSMVSFLPSLFGFSLMVSSKWGAALGLLWLIGKWAFLFGRKVGADSSEWYGHVLAQLAQLGLLNGVLISAARVLIMEIYRNFTASAHQPGALPA